MIVSSEVAQTDVEQMLHFYRQKFAVVEVVSCNKCGVILAIQCEGGDPMGLAINEAGKIVIPVGENLLSSRVRLDEAPTGERMLGYQCGNIVPNPDYPAALEAHQAAVEAYDLDYHKRVKVAKKDGSVKPVYEAPVMTVPETIPCGNDTRIADVERGKVPVGQQRVSLTPFDKHNITEHIRKTKHKPDFKKRGNIKTFETFQVERIM